MSTKQNKISREMRLLLRGYARQTLTVKQKTKLLMKLGVNQAVNRAFVEIRDNILPPPAKLSVTSNQPKPIPVSEAKKAEDFRPNSIYMKLRTTLYDHGLFEEQADAILARVMEKSEPMAGRWNDPVDAYPPFMINVLWMGVKPEAVRWIDENMPLHWARPMFTGELDKKPEPKVEEKATNSAVQNMDKAALAAYYEKLFSIGEVVLDTLAANNVSVYGTPRLYTEGVNPCYSQIPFNGGIALEFYYGSPAYFHTPLGKMQITGGASHSGSSQRDAVNALQERLGLIEIVPKEVNNMGEFGPIYAVTKDADGNTLPLPVLGKGQEKISYEDADSLWNEIKPMQSSRRQSRANSASKTEFNLGS